MNAAGMIENVPPTEYDAQEHDEDAMSTFLTFLYDPSSSYPPQAIRDCPMMHAKIYKTAMVFGMVVLAKKVERHILPSIARVHLAPSSGPCRHHLGSGGTPDEGTINALVSLVSLRYGTHANDDERRAVRWWFARRNGFLLPSEEAREVFENKCQKLNMEITNDIFLQNQNQGHVNLGC